MQLVDLWYFILSLIQKDWIAWASVVLYYFFNSGIVLTCMRDDSVDNLGENKDHISTPF